MSEKLRANFEQIIRGLPADLPFMPGMLSLTLGRRVLDDRTRDRDRGCGREMAQAVGAVRGPHQSADRQDPPFEPS